MHVYYLITFLVALLASFTLTPFVRQLSIKNKWLDKPGQRKMNKKPVPTAGGIAIYLGFVLAIAFFMFKKTFAGDLNKFVGFLGGGLIIVLSGIQDDIKGLTPRRKLFYQIMAASIASIFGYVIFKVSGPFGGAFHLTELLSMVITIFWIVGITNAVNLLDGLDGLASGVVAIIAVTLFFAALKSASPVVALLSIAVVGSSLGFLPHNFYPARIFMGDTGSMFLGFGLALISIEGAHKGSTLITLFIPIIAMGVPVVDTFLSILRRLVKGNGVFRADKEHIHHKLVFLNGSQRDAVLRLYFLTACFGLIAVSFTGMRGIWSLFALIATAILTLRWVVNHGFLDFVEHEKGQVSQRGKLSEQEVKSSSEGHQDIRLPAFMKESK
ncbi:MAG: undecaprenyl/decaprenyl-phosphate alpha-N-acetylglucosaminyl 1-phosphate transferase [Candidatus Omnitrophica bacterium]|nr:undecaprenyl/decaprenyl-phosphate alpha-N-acetylglucosaminyl 1-phosphate transferase [Candidatus Omnitrophota bacterium]